MNLVVFTCNIDKTIVKRYNNKELDKHLGTRIYHKNEFIILYDRSQIVETLKLVDHDMYIISIKNSYIVIYSHEFEMKEYKDINSLEHSLSIDQAYNNILNLEKSQNSHKFIMHLCYAYKDWADIKVIKEKEGTLKCCLTNSYLQTATDYAEKLQNNSIEENLETVDIKEYTSKYPYTKLALKSLKSNTTISYVGILAIQKFININLSQNFGQININKSIQTEIQG